MTISAKLKYETSHHLDHEMREYYQARIKGYIKPSVNKKLRHETFLDFELRKYYQARIKGYIQRSPETKAHISNWRKNQIKVSKSVV